MERQKEMVYQLDLFSEQAEETISLGTKVRNVKEEPESQGLQVTGASEQGRALTRDKLMQHVCSSANIVKAYNQVKRNKGCPGIDKQDVESFRVWYTQHGESLRQELLTGKYTPSAVKEVKISKPDGGIRLLGIPTIKDRVIQQAIYQVLNPIFEKDFSDNSYGFRKGRNAHQALKKSKEYVQSGYNIVVDIDLEKFFDRVNHDRLMHRLSLEIGDKVLMKLIRKYLQSGIIKGGLESQRISGTPQGSPLSPLLSNIVLDELDKELESRGHKFCRYADDCNIYVRSQRAGERVMQSISDFIEKRLKLQINRSKSKVATSKETKFLGYRLYTGGIMTIHPKSIKRLKDKVRQITKRNRGVSFSTVIDELNRVLRGWFQYYKISEWRADFRSLDEWIRRKLRCYRLKQCQRKHAIKLFLCSLGAKESSAWNVAMFKQGWWQMSKSATVGKAMNIHWFHELGLFCLASNFDVVHKL